MKTDVKSAYANSTGVIYGARTRLRGALIIPGGSAGSVVISSGDGTTLLSTTTLGNGTPFSVLIPEDGIVAVGGLQATISNASINVFYG